MEGKKKGVTDGNDTHVIKKNKITQIKKEGNRI